MLADKALVKLIEKKPKTVLNIGDKSNSNHTKIMEKNGINVFTINLDRPARVVAPYLNTYCSGQDFIWCSHVLEHQRNPGQFLDKVFADLKEKGLLVITVPPAKKELAGGHVTIWNETVLLYQLILAGFDCKKAMVMRYGYNISVLVRKISVELPKLTHGKGDLNAIKTYMPKY